MKTISPKKYLISMVTAGLAIAIFSFLSVFLFDRPVSIVQAAESQEIPARGMVTMVDLGADKCIPCKMMAPVMEKIEKKYQGKAVIHFFDVWKDRAPGERFGIRAIPTQIFFDKDAKEVYRHEGFMSEADITAQLAKMGVK